MKKLHLIFLVIIGCWGSISAQNYQTVFQDRAIYFNNGSSQESARFDSVYLNPTQLFPYTIVRQIDINCFSLEPSRLGRSVILRENGYNEFITSSYDTLKIKTDALLNESWIFYRDSLYEVTATVSSITEESLFGVPDSVKNITLQFKDLNGNPVNHYFNTITIKLSKNYGLKQWFDFALFPNYETSGSINLTGLTNPNVGFINFTWFETFDFHPGDEFHIYYRLNDFQTQIYVKTVLKYLSRMVTNDSIEYFVDKEEVYHYVNNVYRYTHDTIREVIKRNFDFDNILPNEPYYVSLGFSFIAFSNTIKYIPTVPLYGISYYPPYPPCYTYAIFDGCFEALQYYKGLGGPYYNCGFHIQSSERTLVYYKKDGISYGTPFNLLGVENQIEIEESFTLFPNPAVDQVTVTCKQEGVYTIEFYDLSAKLVQSETITNTEQVINISSLNTGMYLYRIKDGKKTIQTGKLIRL